MAVKEPKIILYHYHFSPYAHKVSWYLNLRGIKYYQCMQPPILPRPDLASLGVSYRRIPVLAIGNEIFCDTYLIIRELEKRFPQGRLLKNEGHWAKMEEMESWADTLFPECVKCISTNLPLMRDEKFVKDRENYSGRSFRKEDMDARRPEALKEIRKAFIVMEDFLSDSRPWILGSEFSLVDLEAVWPFEWMITMPGALENTAITPSNFPKTFSYVSRFTSLLKSSCPDPKINPTISGSDAKEAIISCSKLAEEVIEIGLTGSEDQRSINFGEEVEVAPVDSGKNHPQRGRVRGLDEERVVLEVVPTGEVKDGRTVRVVFPIRGFEIRSVAAQGGAKL
ncbi:hypothetical protein RUND412_002583 [Rhizina undulata]